ncbi:hypothetical protein U9M48_042254 [Paspalum notatum var. saurae]|uniref:KIB1-4 beta-propeller domain-containing protein n=1 Tax=Paspalum notatum var. saurae TaxID=547442 RepID=A0AAQ3XHE5_PASNO
MMTRARRRRRRSVAESTPFQAARKTQSLPPDPNEWRDWANLLPEMVDEISGRLLSADVAEYLRFRAVCRPWRSRTQDPRAHPLHRRFRPRNWMVVTMIPDPEPRRRLLNLSTAASLGVDLPALLPPVRHRRATGTEVIRLLNPLTNTVTDFPSITRIVAPTPSESQSSVLQKPGCVSPRVINGAGFDDSTSPPTLVLCPRDCASSIIFPKPGDAHWTLVSRGEARYPPFDVQGRVLYHSFISLRGRCYLTSPELQPLPRLVEVINQRHLCAPDTHHLLHIQSFLEDADDGALLEKSGARAPWRRRAGSPGPDGAFHGWRRGVTLGMELLEVDIARRRLIPVRSLGRHAVFVGLTHCHLISTERFPSVAADAIYMGYRIQRIVKFSMYQRNNKRTEPMHDFRLNKHLLQACQP